MKVGRSRIIAVVVGTAGCVCVRAFVWECMRVVLFLGNEAEGEMLKCEIQEEVVNGGDIQLG